MEAKTLAELVTEAGSRYAGQPAYIWRPGLRAVRFTYGDVYQTARRAAALLEQHGVRPGDRVLLWAVNSPYWVSAFFGCQLHGAVAVPLMVQNTPDFVSRIAEFTEARLILKSPARHIALAGIPALDVESALAAAADDEFTPANPDPEDIAQILFTSGTTGVPKGVPLKHRNILANVRDILTLDLITPGDHLMSILPLAHAFEQVASLFTAMALGLTVTQAASLSGLRIRNNMIEDHPTILVAVPEFLKLAVQQIEAKAEKAGRKEKLQTLFRLGPKLPAFVRRRLARPVLSRFGGRLRRVISGGSALDPAVGEKWEALGVPVIQGYGATECSPVVSANRPRGRKVASVGPPLPSVQVKLAPDGEILVKGPNVADGYYRRPDETAERFRDGWYHTDDLGAFDGDGHLRIKGRKKFLIVTPAGENVYPEDVENELNREPEVRDSAVLGRQSDARFEIHAVLLPKPGAALDARAVVERVNPRLQPHQRVQGVSVWEGEDFPRTATRKVKKNEVLAWLAAREAPEAAAGLPVPVGAVERVVARAVGRPADQIRPEMRLEGDLKLDSLGRVTLVGLIEEELGVVLDEGQIGPQTTVADIKDLVGRREQKEERYEFREWPLSTPARAVRALGWSLFFRPYLRWVARPEVVGCEHLEGLQGPVLFLPNHRSPIDGGVALHALPRRFRRNTAIAAATDVLYEHPATARWAGVVELLFNTYPFDRVGQVKSSLQYTGRLMDRGFSVMLFPEGQMEQEGHLLEVRGGAGIIAVEIGAPVVPVGLTGTDLVVSPKTDRIVLPRRGRVRVAFGEPLRFASGTDYEAAGAAIQEALRRLVA
ncbi:MAG: AMP-binding protein [Armatimonadetes bacterium]|nr:AMP-binding protein [Armatimonadota bacterium]